MAEIINNFLAGGMDKDSNGRLIEKGGYRDMVNCRVDSSNNNGVVEKVLGTDLLVDLIPGGIVYGYEKHEDYHYYFGKSSGGNDIIGRYKTINEVIVDVNFLNFSAEIIEINFIDDDSNNRFLIYWTDGVNPPRYVDTVLALSNPAFYQSELAFSVIKAPPSSEPDIVMIYSDKVSDNKIANNAFRFAYRYLYKTGETSAISAYSRSSFYYGVTQSFTDLPKDNIMSNEFNGVAVVLNIEPELVDFIDKVEVFAIDVGSSTMYKIHTKESNFGSSFEFEFFNSKAYPIVSSNDVNKLYDNVPLISIGQELIQNVLIYSNYTDGYNNDIIPDWTPEITNNKVFDEVILTEVGSDATTVSFSVGNLKRGNILFFSFTLEDNTGTVSDGDNRGFYSVVIVLEDDYVDFAALIPFATSYFNNKGFNVSAVGDIVSVTIIDNTNLEFNTAAFANLASNLEAHLYTTLVQGVPYTYGIVYMDEYGRTGAVIKSDEIISESYEKAISTSPISIRGTNYNRTGKVTIKHTPPSWAKKFKILRSKPNLTSEFIRIDGAQVHDNKIYIEVADGYQQLTSVDSIYVESFTPWLNANNNHTYFKVVVKDIETTDSAHALGAGLWIVIEDTYVDGFAIADINRGLDAFNTVGASSGFVMLYTNDESSSDLMYETPGTYLIENGYHIHKSPILDGYFTDVDQTVSTDFVVNLIYDADLFFAGIGLGGDTAILRRISDVNNYSTVGRPNLASENFKQSSRESSVTYSDTYVEETGFNGLSSFNTSLINFKDYDRVNGPIRMTHSRDTDLVIFQRDKVIAQPFNKNMLFSVGGDAQLTSGGGVLGTHTAYNGEFGMSHRTSFAKWGHKLFWADAKRGVVCRMDVNGIFPISDHKMKDFFFGVFDTNPNYDYRGAYVKDFDEYAINVGVDTYFFNYKMSKWTHRQEFTPDLFSDDELNMYSIKGTSLYIQESGILANFYGVQKNAVVNFFINLESNIKKVLKALIIEGDAWDTTIVNTENGSTTIAASEYESKEGFKYADVPMIETQLVSKNNDIGGIGVFTATEAAAPNTVLLVTVIPEALCIGNEISNIAGTVYGVVVDIEPGRITVNQIITPSPEFILYRKNSKIEGSPMRDYMFDVTIQSDGAVDDSVFAVKSEVSQSLA